MTIDQHETALLKTLVDQSVRAGALEPHASGRLARLEKAGLVRQVSSGPDLIFVLTGAGIAASRRPLPRSRRVAGQRLA